MCRINMQGFQIEVDYGSHVRYRLQTRFEDMDCDYLDYSIEVLFSDEQVADYLLNEVRIGDDVVLVDEDSGISFALAVGTNQIYIKTVYNAYERMSAMHVADKQQVLRYAEKLGVRAEIFERKRREVYA